MTAAEVLIHGGFVAYYRKYGDILVKAKEISSLVNSGGL